MVEITFGASAPLIHHRGPSARHDELRTYNLDGLHSKLVVCRISIIRLELDVNTNSSELWVVALVRNL